MTQLYEIKVKLSENQNRNLSRDFHHREIVLRLASNTLSGSDMLYVRSNIVKRLNTNRRINKGMDIKLAKTNIRKQVGGSLLTSILSMGRALAPTLGKTLSLSSLAGLASEGASQLVKKISGGNLASDMVTFTRKLQKQITGGQVGGFFIPQNKIKQLIVCKYLLSAKQKQNILNALQTSSGVHIKPTKTQMGRSLGTILASTGIPIAMKLVKKKITGRGAPRLRRSTTGKQNGHGAPRLGMYQTPPPFIGTWEQMRGGGKKKNSKGPRPVTRSQFVVQKHSSSWSYTVKPKFHKNISMSIHDLLEWCRI